MTKKTYSVTSPIKCGGKKYAVGATIDLDDEEAAELRAADVIGPLRQAQDRDEVAAQGGGSAPTGEACPKPIEVAERIAAIADAIGKIDDKDTSLWMKSGAPKTESIAAITGWPVTGKDRDAAWAEFNGVQ